MANPKGNKANHMLAWQPGESGNYAGRPRIREDLRDVKLVGRDEIRRLMYKIADMTRRQLVEMSKN